MKEIKSPSLHDLKLSGPSHQPFAHPTSGHARASQGGRALNLEAPGERKGREKGPHAQGREGRGVGT